MTQRDDNSADSDDVKSIVGDAPESASSEDAADEGKGKGKRRGRGKRAKAEAEPLSRSGEASAAEAGGSRIGRWLEDERLGWRVAGVTTIAAVLSMVAAAIFASWWAPLHAEARDRDQVAQAAAEFSVHLSTFTGATIDEWVSQTQARSTGRYADQVAALFDLDLREALAELEVESEGALVDLYIQELGDETATAFAVVRQTVTNAEVDEAFQDELRMEIGFRYHEGAWLVSEVAVLGPARSTVPAESVPEPDSDAVLPDLGDDG